MNDHAYGTLYYLLTGYHAVHLALAIGAVILVGSRALAGHYGRENYDALRGAAASIPLDRILVETDSPFLAPQRLRGRDNEPANVLDVIEELARVRSEPLEVVRDATIANAKAAFPALR
jgi:Tat protein secretion system quality control protein TatD with DNase activity